MDFIISRSMVEQLNDMYGAGKWHIYQDSGELIKAFIDIPAQYSRDDVNNYIKSPGNTICHYWQSGKLMVSTGTKKSQRVLLAGIQTPRELLHMETLKTWKN